MKSIKWWALLGMTSMVMACGSGVDDSEQVKDLEDEQVEDLCSDACSDSEPYELMCEEGGVTATVSSDADSAACEAQCVMLKAAADACNATAGDVRVAFSKPGDCDEVEAVTEANIKLLTCL